MKKLGAGVITAVMVMVGIVAFSPGGTQAAPPPYPGTVPTYCSASPANNNAKAGQPAKVNFQATTKGNGRPKGVVTFTYTKNGKSYGAFARDYTGGKKVFILGAMPQAGTYDVMAHFNSQPKNSAYKNCSKSFPHRFQGKK